MSIPITEFQSKDYKKLKKNGICTQCKTEKAIPGQTKCESCRKMHLENYHRVQEFKSDAKKASCDSEFSIGDEVTVEWLNQDKTKSSTAQNRGYGDGGIIEHINDKFLSIRHKLGYITTVSIADMTDVAIVTVVNKKEEDVADNRVRLTGKDVADSVIRLIENEGFITKKGDVKLEDLGVMEDDMEAQTTGGFTPVECVKRELSMDEALPMKLSDLTKEDAEFLLTAGVSKHKLGLLYGASTGVFYRKLTSLGLHIPGDNPGDTREEYTNEPQVEDKVEIRSTNKAIPLEEAILLRDRAVDNDKCMMAIRKSLLADEFAITKDVDSALANLSQQYKAEVERIEDALSKVRVII